jgi:hypothetical protein
MTPKYFGSSLRVALSPRGVSYFLTGVASLFGELESTRLFWERWIVLLSTPMPLRLLGLAPSIGFPPTLFLLLMNPAPFH